MKTYNWCVDIVLKNSGVIMPCVHEGPEDNSADVFRRLFKNVGNTNDVINLACNNGQSNAFIVAGEIASIDIYKKKEGLL